MNPVIEEQKKQSTCAKQYFIINDSVIGCAEVVAYVQRICLHDNTI